MASEDLQPEAVPALRPTRDAPRPAGRSPVQDRSAATVRKINAAAVRLLGHGIPPSRLTTAQIAREAGVSVGALYRFFPDKETLILALAAERFAAFEATLQREIEPGLLTANGPALVARLVNATASLFAAHPELLTIVYGGPELDCGNLPMQGRPGLGAAALLRRHMVEGLGHKVTPDLDLRLRVAAEAGDRLIGFAFEQRDPQQREAILDEAKRLLSGYLFG
ncbi:TetR family transcriptional regulator [Methylobacterium sp. P31]